MVQHTLLVKNVANTLLRAELAKILGEQHKIVSVSFKDNTGNKGGIKYALVVVDSQADLATVSGLINKKTVNGKELQVSAAKAPHERGSHVNRVAKLKQIEKFSSVWPAPTYKNVANSDPLKNLAFPPTYIHGEKIRVQRPKTIKKKVSAPSTALYLSNLKGVNKKQILEAFKNAKVRRAQLNKNFGFVLFKDAEERKKAQEAVKDKITVGDKTISVAESKKFGRKTVEVPNPAPPAPKPAEKKELSVNAIAKKRFTSYRKSLQSQKNRLVRLAAIKKLQEHKLAVTQGKAQPRVVRKLKPKKTIVKPNPKEVKRAQRKAARKTRAAKNKNAVKRKPVKKVAAKVAAKAAPAAAVTATA